jgi:hypothetical protein
VIFTNGAQVNVIDPTTGIFGLSADGTLPVMATLCDYKGQLVAGKVTGYPVNAVVWGEVGRASLVHDKDIPTTGWRTMPWAGAVHVVRRLGDFIIAYGAGGSAILQCVGEPITTMKVKELMPFGVAGRGCVGGDLHMHLILDEAGCLWSLSEDLTLKELGYREFFEPLLGTDIMISMDPELHYYYISNATDGYLLTPEGLSKTYQRVTSCAHYSGGPIGIFSPSSDLSVVVATDVQDFKIRGQKTIQGVEVAGSGTGLRAAYDLRSALTGAYTRTPSLPLNNLGQLDMHGKAADFKIRLTATSYSGMVLDYMNIKYKVDDKRFMRERVYASQAFSGSDR